MAHTGGVLRLPGGEMLKNETSRAFLGPARLPTPCNRVRKITDAPPRCQGKAGGYGPSCNL